MLNAEKNKKKILDITEGGDYFAVRKDRQNIARSCDGLKCEDCVFDEDDDFIQTIAIDVEFAWAISSDELLKVCQKYHVDMRIYAFERGMEFNLEIEIINGKVTKDSYFAFQDYTWECICPHVGG